MQKAMPREVKMVPSRVWSPMQMGGPGSFTPSRWDKRQIVEEAYEGCLPFFAAVNLIAEITASMPWKVRTGAPGHRALTDSHPMLRMIGRNSSIYEVIEYMVRSYCTFGETHSLIERGSMAHNKFKPLALIPMPEVLTENIQGTWRQPIRAYRVGGEGELFPERDVIHLWKPSLSEFFEPMPTAIPARRVITLNNAGLEWNTNVAQGGGIPPVVAKIPGNNRKSAQEFKKDFGRQRGAKSAHEMTVVPNTVEFEHFSNVQPHDAEWGNAIMTTMRMIFMSLNVSSSLMNDAANKTYNNAKESKEGLYTEACLPIAGRIAAAINKKISHEYEDDPELEVDEKEIDAIQEKVSDKWNRIIKGIDAGLITKNEGRRDIGREPGVGPTADILINSRTINNIPKFREEDQAQEPDPENPENPKKPEEEEADEADRDES